MVSCAGPRRFCLRPIIGPSNRVVWGVNGVVEVELDALDTDEVADEEGVAVEALLESGWTIDWGLPEEQDG